MASDLHTFTDHDRYILSTEIIVLYIKHEDGATCGLAWTNHQVPVVHAQIALGDHGQPFGIELSREFRHRVDTELFRKATKERAASAISWAFKPPRRFIKSKTVTLP